MNNVYVVLIENDLREMKLQVSPELLLSLGSILEQTKVHCEHEFTIKKRESRFSLYGAAAAYTDHLASQALQAADKNMWSHYKECKQVLMTLVTCYDRSFRK